MISEESKDLVSEDERIELVKIISDYAKIVDKWSWEIKYVDAKDVFAEIGATTFTNLVKTCADVHDKTVMFLYLDFLIMTFLEMYFKGNFSQYMESNNDVDIEIILTLVRMRADLHNILKKGVMTDARNYY